MHLTGCTLKISPIELDHTEWRLIAGHRCGFKNLVIQGDGQFLIVQSWRDFQTKLPS